VTLSPLSHDKHARLRQRPLASYRFVAEFAVAPISLSEAPRSLHEFPLLFTAEPEGYFPSALLGLDAGSNLFVDAAGRWTAGYVPAFWRQGAFRLARLQGRDEWVLCLDTTSEQLNEEDGLALFDENGQPTAFVSQVFRFLVDLETDRGATIAACAALDRHGLIVPYELKVEHVDGSKTQLQGLYRVDQERLAGLGGEALGDLQAARALPLIYAHLFSLPKLALLGKLAAQRDKVNEGRQKTGTLDLDRLFGIVEDDPFIF
jgi:hypothetical protein